MRAIIKKILKFILLMVCKWFCGAFLFYFDAFLTTTFIIIFVFILVGVLYLVPATLYCLYNNLSFLNLSSFDPTTYFVLLQLKVLVTGLLFQVRGIFSSLHFLLLVTFLDIVYISFLSFNFSIW